MCSPHIVAVCAMRGSTGVLVFPRSYLSAPCLPTFKYTHLLPPGAHDDVQVQPPIVHRPSCITPRAPRSTDAAEICEIIRLALDYVQETHRRYRVLKKGEDYMSSKAS